jgi:hypothetical protein
MQPQRQAGRSDPSRDGDAVEQSSRLAKVAATVSYLQIGGGLALIYGQSYGHWPALAGAAKWGVMLYIAGIAMQNGMPLILRLGSVWSYLNRSRGLAVHEPTTSGEDA